MSVNEQRGRERWASLCRYRRSRQDVSLYVGDGLMTFIGIPPVTVGLGQKKTPPKRGLRRAGVIAYPLISGDSDRFPKGSLPRPIHYRPTLIYSLPYPPVNHCAITENAENQAGGMRYLRGIKPLARQLDDSVPSSTARPCQPSKTDAPSASLK